MQAIVTKFFGPTNHCGTRIKATAAAGYHWHAWDYSRDVADNHIAAARALASKLRWTGHWFGGGNPDGEGFTFVCEDGQTEFRTGWEGKPGDGGLLALARWLQSNPSAT